MAKAKSLGGKLSSFKRKKVDAGATGWVKTHPLNEGDSLPLCIVPEAPGLDFAEWAESQREWIEDRLRASRALLFRGFKLDADGFHAFVKATSTGPLLEYKDRSTPRTTVSGDRVYSSTVYPPEERINLHNEGTYWMRWPLKLYFCCLTAPQSGGQTPIANTAEVYRRIDPKVRDKFEAAGVRYVRNYNQGFGLKWEEVFQSTARADVEAYCVENDIQFEWLEDDKLRTIQIRPAVRTHPWRGEKIWFNHGAFFHYSALEPRVRDALVSEFGEARLPFNTYYGDGSTIDPSDVAHILEAYAAERVSFSWQKNDVMLLDNMSVAHAREPYTGDRLVAVAMTEAASPASVGSEESA